MNIEKEHMVLAGALLVGGGAGTGTTFLTQQHSHPELVKEIRTVQYELELDTVVLRLDAMDRAGVKPGDRNYDLFVSIQKDLVSRLKELNE